MSYLEDNRGDPVKSRVEAVSNTSTVHLRVVGGDGKGIWSSRLGGVSNLRQQNVVMSPAGRGPENDCAGEDQQQF
jgi:hypothetical protein